VAGEENTDCTIGAPKMRSASDHKGSNTNGAAGATHASIWSVSDLQDLIRARGGSSEVTPICDKTIRGDTSTYTADTEKLEFSSWNNTRIRGVVAEKHYFVGVFLNSDPTNSFMSRDLLSGTFIFFKPNTEREAHYVKSMEGAFAHVQADHFEQLLETRGFAGGADNLPARLQTSLPSALSRFMNSSIRRNRDDLQRHITVNAPPVRAINYAFRHFLDNMLDSFAVARDDRHEAQDGAMDPHKLLRGVEDLMREHSGDLLTVTGLSDRFQLSRQALRNAFMDTLGVTPSVYMHNWRLARAREGLQQGHFRSVTDAALHWGFFDCGRFSGYYSRLFHELPSVTLKLTQRAT